MHSRTFKIAIAILSALFIGLVASVYQGSSKAFQKMPETMANVSALTAEGKRTDFESERGRVTLVVLSAEWCPSCVAELTSLKKLHEEFYAEGFRIVMVSEDDSQKMALKFKKTYAMPWTVVHWNYELMNALGNPKVVPVSYLVDSKNRFETIQAGIIDENRMRHAIRSLLQ